jgi:hypothetical protein
MKEASETIPGNYHVVSLPDGTLVAFTKLKNGKWEQTKDRLDEEKKSDTQVQFEKRFDGTTTVPNDFVKKDTETLTPNIDKMIAGHKDRQNRLDAYLGEMLGNPDDIISGKVKVNEVSVVRHKEHMIGLIDVLNSPKWNKVKEIIWK